MLRSIVVFIALIALKVVSHLFYRHRAEWIGDVPRDRWSHLRVLAILNHTSLYEPLMAGFASVQLLWQFAREGVLPVAEKTMKRPVGQLFSLMMKRVVVVTRERDHTWSQVLDHTDGECLITILPEGRMKRLDGLDSKGQPMTVRGGIADILGSVPDGRLLLVYSGGLHHIQAPGEPWPRLFKTLRARIEVLDIPRYRAQLQETADADGISFKRAVIRDLEHRRDTHCPVAGTRSGTAAASPAGS
jgi:hypothetical protein